MSKPEEFNRGEAMHYPIRIESAGGSGFVARDACGVFAEGATPEEAIARLREEAATGQAARREAAMIRPPEGRPNWQEGVSTLDLNDPETQAWWAEVEEFRRQRDVASRSGDAA